MTELLLPGIVAHSVPAPRLTAAVLERPAEGQPAGTVVFVHGNVSSSHFYQPTMLALPPQWRALAVDLRGFGGSEVKPVDATRGLRDFSDDVASVLETLGTGAVHLVGWSMGAGVVLQYLLDNPDGVLSVTLESPVSPYGFGGTALDGSLLTPDAAGTGGGGGNPDFVARLAAGEEQTSPRSVYRAAYVAQPDGLPHEDLWVASMLTTATGEGNYPGDSVPSENWPGFAPGPRGVLNTMAPTHLNLSGITELESKPAILWIRGDADAIVSDTSAFDLNFLGQLGAIPGWPGAEVAPPQPMVSQTRAVLERYSSGGGALREVVFEGCGHSPHLEQADSFVAALVEHLDSAG